MTGRTRRALVALALGAICAGCGVTRLQTAWTTPRGQTRATVAAGLIQLGDRGWTVEGVPAVPLDLMVRHGATDQVDWGVRLFFGLGLLADVKWNLLPAASRTAISVSAGLAGAIDPSGNVPTGNVSKIAHVPLTVTVSRMVRPWFTPYAAVGYGTYWIFNYGEPDPSQTYAARTGTGDGVLTLHAGVELARASGRALFIEYAYARPVVEDPGDFYEFAVNQFFSIGFRTGSGSTFSR